MKINILPFSKVLTDSTKKFTKIKKQDYLENGKYVIIDQGQDFICGYTNDKDVVNFDDIPLIIFGDHTKVLKYIDFPIAIGADGVKALTVDSNVAETKYVYYFLKTLRLYDAGYSRHFKYLKVKKIALPENKNDQIKIANLLSQVEALINKRKESIKLLDELLKSTFLDMFGDPVLNVKEWDTKPLKKFGKVSTGNTPPRKELAYYTPEYIEWIKTDNIDKNKMYLTKAKEYLSEKGLNKGRFVKENSLLVTCIAGSVKSIGNSSVADRKVAFNQQINAIEPNEDMDINFLYWMFKISKKYVQDQAGKGMKKMISKSTFEKIIFPYPPKPLQDKFATIVKQVEESKKKYQESLNELHQLFDSLSQRAFKGELDLSGVEAPVADKVIDVKSHKVDSIAGGENTQATLDIPTLMRKANIDEHIERVDGYTDNTNRPVYSEDFLWMVLSQADDEISYESIASKLEKYSFEEYPDYDRIKSDIFSLIEQKKLKQLFDEDNKSIRLVKAT